ncbi:MAG: DUF4349 domain-containing protein [Acholeplasma sp.]|jgi:hypothetical protein|nr:MAG: DUF4349 domain-containing protein [Acholeplasma sp.]
MKKVVLSLFVCVLLILQGCSSDEYQVTYEDEESQTIVLADELSPVRKIIYEVNIYANVNDLNDAMNYIKTSMNDDEWFDQETINDHSTSLVIRIKSDHLESFIEAIRSEFTVESYQMKATDISLNYQDKTSQIQAIDSQIDRLIELYDEASLSDMLIINQQLSNLEMERNQLQGELNLFDSLADYSEVNLTLYASVIPTESPFIQRLGRAFSKGWDGLIQFGQGLVLLIATMLPFLIFMGTIAILVIIYIKKRNKKMDLMKQKNI